MCTIVVVYSKILVKSYLNRLPQEVILKGHFLAHSTSSSELVDFLNKIGLKPIPMDSISTIQKDEFLTDYLNVMNVLAEHNGHNLFWWATDIASKNRFTSPLAELLSAFAHCLEAIQRFDAQERLLVIIHPPWPVICALEDSARQFGWDLRVFSWPWSKLLARWQGKARAWVEFARGCRGSILRIWEARRHFGRALWKGTGEKPVYLIKSFVYPGSFAKDGRYQDPFFGELSEFLSKNLGEGIDVLTVTAGFEKRGECLNGMRRAKGNPVVPLEVFLSWGDVFKGLQELLWGHFTKPFRIPGGVSFLEHKIGALLKECLTSGGWKIPFYQYLHLAAGSRISKICKLHSCALTFEGNPWEHMFIAGLRHYYPELPIFGYQHSVVPQAAAGVFISPGEKENSPLPSIVLTTGAIPARIMQHYGTLSAGRVRPACALRYQYLYKSDFRKENTKQSGFLVLVALEGVWEVLPLLEYVLDQALIYPNVLFRIRAHPALPLSKLLNRLGRRIKPGGNVVTSPGGTVASDVEDCSAVLYWGTTVALEALMMGKPLIHFDRGDLMSYDPLFEFEDFKWTVGKNKNLHAVLEEIRSLSDQRQAVLKEKGKNYIRSYFHEVNDKSMSQFLPEIRSM